MGPPGVSFRLLSSHLSTPSVQWVCLCAYTHTYTRIVAWRCSLKKSVQIHASSWRGRRCGVAQASLNHLRWCRPHPVCLWVALALGHGGHFIQNSISAIFPRKFSGHCWVDTTHVHIFEGDSTLSKFFAPHCHDHADWHKLCEQKSFS